MTRSHTLFIADLHLTPQRPRALRLFQQFMTQRAAMAARLYILGDLFDTWVGDDDHHPHHDAVRSALRTVTNAGTNCYLITGNRDFLLGPQFAHDTGCILLPDITRIHCGDESVLVTHGDLLCTDDIAYQRFRRFIRHPVIKWLFKRQSLARRQRIAAASRQRGQSATAAKSLIEMDVNQQTVIETMNAHGVTRLIHGHTHRPADHCWTSGNKTMQRQVLAAWTDEAGEVLVTDGREWWRGGN